jgi:hypothetical protein
LHRSLPQLQGLAGCHKRAPGLAGSKVYKGSRRACTRECGELERSPRVAA